MPTKFRKGKVKEPRKRPYLYRDLFRQKVQEAFEGTDGKMADIKSADGQTKIAVAHKETTEALGYTLEDAVAQDELEDIYDDLQYSKPNTGGEELCCSSPSEII